MPGAHTEDFIGNDFIEFPLFRHVLSNHHDDLWTEMVISVKEWAIYSVRSNVLLSGVVVVVVVVSMWLLTSHQETRLILNTRPINLTQTFFFHRYLDCYALFLPFETFAKMQVFFDSDSLEEVTEILVFTLALQRRHFYITVNCRLHLCRRQTTVSPIRSQNSRHSCTCTV